MYFEIDDVKRRHSPYFDVYNVHGWINTPDEALSWTWARSVFAGVTGLVANELFAHKYETYKKLRTNFHPPETLAQVFAFNKAIKATENYGSALRHRLGYALLAGSIDVGSRLTAYRWSVGGLYQSFGSVNTESWRRYLPTILSAAATSWILGPMEISRKAFLSDKTFPSELRKGYISALNAFTRMARANPYSLFKNTLPSVLCSFTQTTFLFGLFDYLYDLFSPMHREDVTSKGPVKLV